jgi:hypothetical protein
MQSRSTLAALSLAHGRFKADRARERDVAIGIVRHSDGGTSKALARGSVHARLLIGDWD